MAISSTSLSPLANQRTDAYGGSFQNRTRLALKSLTPSAPSAVPLALFVRISATDWAQGGWTVDESVQLSVSPRARSRPGDVSSAARSQRPDSLRPGYQVEFAARIRSEAKIPTAAVGLITEPSKQRRRGQGHADLVFLAREFLRDPTGRSTPPPLSATPPVGPSSTFALRLNIPPLDSHHCARTG